MEFKINERGIFFTIGVVIILIPLIFLISFYTGISKTKIYDTAGKIRCDELHYFVEDVKRDLQRAVAIFGRRAAIHSIGYVAEHGSLGNYTFNCTSLCGVDCDKFSYSNNGSEAAIAELILCGTLNGENVSYMVNHTLREWVEKIEEKGNEVHFKTNITIMNITIAQIDAWNFATIIELGLKVYDSGGICFYRETRIKTQSNTSIIGLEDPLYLLSTEGHVMNYIFRCESGISEESKIIGESKSDSGNGTVSGNVILESGIPESEKENFCSDNDVSGLILVMEDGFGSCDEFGDCFNASTQESDHFAGVINYGKNSVQSFVEKCRITIPWIRDTGDINLSDNDCVIIKNSDRCGIHQVLHGIPVSDINFSCYTVSNIKSYKNCPANYSNGPCFFDRLDGSYNLSKKYREQSKKYFNNTLIGIETIIDPDRLEPLGIPVHKNATWVDYLYWKNVTGCEVIGVCTSGYKLRLDCQHAMNYNLDSSCSTANIPPVSNITEPGNNAELNCSDAPFDIIGMADDCDNGVSYVEVGISGVWHNTDWNGTHWNYTWYPVMSGSYTIESRATDNLGMRETPALMITVNVTGCC